MANQKFGIRLAENNGQLQQFLETMLAGLPDILRLGPATNTQVIFTCPHHGRVRVKAAFAAYPS